MLTERQLPKKSELQYTISGLESANEYFITVSAYDESGKLLLESKELCAHTNLTVTSDYTLTKDISAADVCIKSGTLNLNGHTLTVEGDIWLTNGTLNINKGKIYVSEDFNFSNTSKGYSKGCLSMQSADDYILVNGNIYVYAYYNNSKLTAGTLEVKGDFTQKYYLQRYNNNFYCSGSHKVVFSGDKLQNVSFSSLQSQFNTLEVRNFSEGGVVLKTAATVVEIIDNGCNVSFANGERSGWKLENDEVIDGSLNLARGTLDLNGHKLTVTGNLIQSGGNMLVNGGELDVQGDYHIQALNNGSYVPSTGTLTMTDDSDIVKVGGDFLMQSTQSHESLLSAGILTVSGNLEQLSGGSDYNFYTSEAHTVVLNGSKKQTISIYNSGMYYSRITNLKIENASAEGVDVTRGVYILGKLYNTDSIVTNSTNLYITAMTEFPDGRWNYDANFMRYRTISADLEIGGSVYINASFTLESDTSNDNEVDEYSLMVDGDVWLCSGSLTLNNGKLYVGGNFNICEKNKSYSKSSLNMRNSGDYILVNGDMYVYSTKSSELTAGTLEIKGDFTQNYYDNYCRDNFYGCGDHKVILSGEELQTIYFSSAQSRFNTLEVRNFSDSGVVFVTSVSIVDLIDNNCKVSFADGGLSGWTLEDDEVIDGDLNLSGGTLDLNGYKLTITGSLIQSGGNVFVNGGELNVQGDYHIQKLNECGYTESSGTLTMKNDSGTVKVGGDFVMQSTQSHDGLLSAGTLEVSGDLTRELGGTNYGLYASGTHIIVLNGSKKQTLDLYGSNISNLKIENTSAEGVDIISNVFVDGKLYNTDSIVTNGSNLLITASTEFPNNRWNYDISFLGIEQFPQVSVSVAPYM